MSDTKIVEREKETTVVEKEPTVIKQEKVIIEKEPVIIEKKEEKPTVIIQNS